MPETNTSPPHHHHWARGRVDAARYGECIWKIGKTKQKPTAFTVRVEPVIVGTDYRFVRCAGRRRTPVRTARTVRGETPILRRTRETCRNIGLPSRSRPDAGATRACFFFFHSPPSSFRSVFQNYYDYFFFTFIITIIIIVCARFVRAGDRARVQRTLRGVRRSRRRAQTLSLTARSR